MSTMGRFSNYGLSPQNASNTKSPNGFANPNLKGDRQEERSSHSGSEDGSYALYEQQKLEGDIEEETNTALTSQTLNADGTPKRPMNAFMIFARRRRPQVSAENQAMRTGEISKILSKEWVSMPPSEKQFYLEQAKQLKETFNTKYPDYVYRRRPNNSRKRRRSDSGSMRTGDQALMGDSPDDLSGSFDLDASPTDGDVSDHLDSSLPSPYSSRSSQDMSHSLTDHKFSLGQSRPSIGHHPYHHSEPPFRSNGHDAARLSYSGPGNSDRVGQGISSPNTSPRMPIGGMQYSYNQNASHGQSTSVYSTDAVGSHPGWQPRGTNWLSASQDRLPPPIPSHKTSPYSSPVSWPSPSETHAPSANPQSNSSNFFPTLNTPFYPNQPHVPHYQSNSPTSPISPHSTSSPHFDTMAGIPPGSLSRDFPSRGYNSSSSMGSAHGSYPPPPTLRDTLSYPQRTTLPPVQTGSYSHSQPASSSSSGPTPFWRD